MKRSPLKRTGELKRKRIRQCSAKPRRLKTIVRSPEHMAFVRIHQCCAPGCQWSYGIHAHHHRSGSGGGTGLKPGDDWCVPLCSVHHDSVHQSATLPGLTTVSTRDHLRSVAIAMAAKSRRCGILPEAK